MSDETYYYPNKWARVVLTSAEEIVGDKGLAALLNMAKMPEFIDNYPPDDMEKAFPFELVGALQQAIWDMYGPRGARVFATRAGEQSFEDGVKQFGSLASAAQAAMKLGSLEARIKIGLGFFAKVFNQVSDQVVKIKEEDEHFVWVIERCPVCWGREADQAVCHLAIGVLRSALAWATNGKEFRMAETQCHAMGAENCVIMIDKKPIE